MSRDRQLMHYVSARPGRRVNYVERVVLIEDMLRSPDVQYDIECVAILIRKIFAVEIKDLSLIAARDIKGKISHAALLDQLPGECLVNTPVNKVVGRSFRKALGKFLQIRSCIRGSIRSNICYY